MSSFHYLLSTSIVSDVSPPGISSQQGTAAAGPLSRGMNTQHTTHLAEPLLPGLGDQPRLVMHARDRSRLF